MQYKNRDSVIHCRHDMYVDMLMLIMLAIIKANTIIRYFVKKKIEMKRFAPCIVYDLQGRQSRHV